MADFTLPELQARLPIVNPDRTPTIAFHRYFNIDFAGAIEKQEAAQAAILLQLQQAQTDIIAAQADILATQATQNAEIARLNRVLNGTENFTGLMVGGQGVKPFLDNTDGTKLTNSAGLASAVVTTPALQMDSVTKSQVQVQATPSISIKSTTDVVLITITGVTVTSGERVDLISNVSLFLDGGNPGAIGTSAAVVSLKVKRGGLSIGQTTPSNVIRGINLTASGAVIGTDYPGAGTFSYTLEASVNSTTDVNSADAVAGYLQATVVKR